MVGGVVITRDGMGMGMRVWGGSEEQREGEEEEVGGIFSF